MILIRAHIIHEKTRYDEEESSACAINKNAAIKEENSNFSPSQFSGHLEIFFIF
jgi:hypothetical protein